VERVLVVDDEEGIRTFIGEVLEGQGLNVTLAEDGEPAAAILERQTFHLLVTDLKMPRMDGMTLLRKARTEHPGMEVIVLTAHGTVSSAVEAMKLGAFDYLTKPLSGPDELRLVVSRALERRRLRDDHQRARRQAPAPVRLVARDPAMAVVVEQIRKVAPTDATVLILGESGTGKEVVAQQIHLESRRRDGPFVAVNCGALSETLLESEMFGHEKGAFTGAVGMHRGRFELADGGTLFLDEVAELKPDLQVKLLRVLEERRFERVGGVRTIEVDLRLVAATNRDLDAEIRAGRFREDLYHRLAVFPLRLPPLRERALDIPVLVDELLSHIAQRSGRPALHLDASAMASVQGYSWPGNVRELANVLERAAILSDGEEITVGDLGLGARLVTGATAGLLLDGTLKDLEKEAIRRVLAANGGHRKKTAGQLGIGLRTLYEKLKEYGLD
jgi:two-component system, NtrC family, response regulator AtoC